MSYLIFCSFEVGGLPYKIAEMLNRHGVETYYISLAPKALSHDSTQFHYGSSCENWNLSHLFSIDLYSSKKIIKLLNQIKRKYNISYCFATGSKSYLLRKAGINYKYWSYGSDLDQNCFAPVWPSNYPFWKKCVKYPYFMFSTRRKARESIYYADSVMIAQYQIEELNKICSDKKLFFLPHFLKVFDYKILLQQKLENKNRICEEIQAKNFFFSSARHFWAGLKSNMSDNKGNDVILNSFAKYLEISHDYDVKLILVKKGPDVELSKLLTQKLGIDKHIVWKNEMRREELDKYYQGATMCFGQFGTPVITFAAIEPLCNASICISYFDENSLIVPFYKEIPPIINSKNPDDIANHMYRLTRSNDFNADLRYKSWHWVKDNCSEEMFVKSFIQLFNQDIPNQQHSNGETNMSYHAAEVDRGERFEFGKNWSRFLSVLNNERIAEAEKSLRKMLEVNDLKGKSFLDIGSGSGLFSLTARRLGASVRSFDYDPQSVACTAELKQRYFPDDPNWLVEEGSVLDTEYLRSLGKFDIVYSWGVLHHTGNMWQALENVCLPVKKEGQLFIAIYNDQGGKSKQWREVKKFYCSGKIGKVLVSAFFIPYFILGGIFIDLIKMKNPTARYADYKKSRGMSIFHDWFDWLGGFPFEVAKPEEIFDFYKSRGFVLQRLKTCGGGLGNNEFVFKKSLN